MTHDSSDVPISAPGPAPAPGTISAQAVLRNCFERTGGFRCTVVSLSDVVRGMNVHADLRTPFEVSVSDGVLKSVDEGGLPRDLPVDKPVRLVLAVGQPMPGGQSPMEILRID